MTIRPLLPDDLLMLAYRLAGWDSGPGRPRAIELRRAVSTAYYALFHGWTWTVAAELLGHPSDHRVPDVCRWINHSDVLELLSSVLLAQGELSRNKANTAKHIEPMLPRPLDPRLVMVSRTFRHLQQQRHAADYDDRYDITKRSALEKGYPRRSSIERAVESARAAGSGARPTLEARHRGEGREDTLTCSG